MPVPVLSINTVVVLAFIPIKFMPAVDVACWLASKVRLPFTVRNMELALNTMFLLAFISAAPVPASIKSAPPAKLITSMPGVGSSF